MHGVAPPLVTPFTDSGDIDEDALRHLVGHVEDCGVHFLVPGGSTSEAELLTADERARVIEIVAEAATVPVIAGAGHPGYRETMAQIEAAEAAGVDGVMVVTPFYYHHDQATLAAYYRDVADAASVPIYLYAVPVYTHVHLEPTTVGELAEHPNIAGMKDSTGDLGTLVRTIEATKPADFAVLTGSANLLASGLEHGASGAILALANLVPEATSSSYDRFDDDRRWAHQQVRELIPLNDAITSRYGIPGLKWAMRQRGLPAGQPRRPFRAPSSTATAELAELLNDIDG